MEYRYDSGKRPNVPHAYAEMHRPLMGDLVTERRMVSPKIRDLCSDMTGHKCTHVTYRLGNEGQTVSYLETPTSHYLIGRAVLIYL